MRADQRASPHITRYRSSNMRLIRATRPDTVLTELDWLMLARTVIKQLNTVLYCNVNCEVVLHNARAYDTPGRGTASPMPASVVDLERWGVHNKCSMEKLLLICDAHAVWQARP